MNFLGLVLTFGMIAASAFGGGVSADIIGENITPVHVENKDSLAQDPFVGIWYCQKSILEGFATADIYLIVEKKGYMYAMVTTNVPSLSYEYRVTYYLDWKHKYGTQYNAFRDGKTIKFQCDGKKVVVSGNPYKLNFTTLKLADIDTSLEFRPLK